MRRSPRRAPDLFRKSVGDVLRSRRREKGKLSQQALSLAAGLAPNVVGELERGKRGIDAEVLVKICAVLKVPVSVFLEDVKVAQVKAVRPVEKQLHTKPGSSGWEHAESPSIAHLLDGSRNVPWLNVIYLGFGMTRTEGDLNAWIEALLRLSSGAR